MLILLAFALLFAGIIAVGSIIYIAPVFFAELLLDVGVTAGLYRRLRHIQSKGWLAIVIRRTWLRAAIVAISFGIAGFIMKFLMPSATSFKQFLQGI